MNRVGKIYYRKSKSSGEAIMIIKKLNDKTYYRDVWGINKGDNYNLYVDDDITIEELEYIFNSGEYTVLDVVHFDNNIKQLAINCLFKSNIERRS